MLSIDLLRDVAIPAALRDKFVELRDIMFDTADLTLDQERQVLEHVRTIPGARNLVTLGQFLRIMPTDTRRRSALLAYLYDADRPSGYSCDQCYRIDTQYTKRAALLLVRKVQQAQELVNA
ncbi:hypothetical protein [Vibrio phage VP16T]|nr:hypothetical protein [Vibrio phage VP16T]